MLNNRSNNKVSKTNPQQTVVGSKLQNNKSTQQKKHSGKKTPKSEVSDSPIMTTATKATNTSSTKSRHKSSSTIIMSNCSTNNHKKTNNLNQHQLSRKSYRDASNASYAQAVSQDINCTKNTKLATACDSKEHPPTGAITPKHAAKSFCTAKPDSVEPSTYPNHLSRKINAADKLTAALVAPCAKCSPQTSGSESVVGASTYSLIGPLILTGKQFRKSKTYVSNRGVGGCAGRGSLEKHTGSDGNFKQQYRRSSFDRNFAERNKCFVPIVQPPKPILSSSNIAAVVADTEKLTIIERLGKGRISYPMMQCGTLEAPDSSYHQQRSHRMDVFQIDDGFHSDGGTETPPPSPSSGSSIASTSDHGSLESVDAGGAQRLAVLSFEQVCKLNDVMDETVAIHGRGNFPTLEVKLKDLVNLVRRKLEADVGAGGAGVIVKDIRLNGGAASHVLASEDQPYNDLDLIYAIELSSSRHFDRVKTAVLNTLLDLLPEGVSKRRIMPCALKEAYVGKMVKVNNNNDGDRWSLISLGNSPGHKNVELKFVDTMRRQFEFSVDSFQIVLDSLLLFYDCAALPISENFYPTVVGESVYGDFQEALYHLQKKLISTRQPEEIRGGGLLKYCNLLVRNYKAVDPQRIKTLERYMCSRFFIDFPDINTQTVKLEAYLRNHFWGIDEEPLQYQYLMHLREVVEMSTVCLMGHERRQTLLLIQSLAAQVLYKEQQKHQQAQEQYHQQQQQQHQQQVVDLQQQPSSGIVALQHHPQQMFVQQQQQQQPVTTNAGAVSDPQQQQQTSATSVAQTIQIQTGPPSLIYANGVYYAPVIPTTICTCNSTWLST